MPMGAARTLFAKLVEERVAVLGARSEVAKALNVGPSTLHYWLHGSEPREHHRKAIAKWSRGRIPADMPWSDDKAA